MGGLLGSLSSLSATELGSIVIRSKSLCYFPLLYPFFISWSPPLPLSINRRRSQQIFRQILAPTPVLS